MIKNGANLHVLVTLGFTGITTVGVLAVAAVLLVWKLKHIYAVFFNVMFQIAILSTMVMHSAVAVETISAHVSSKFSAK
jgi:hypothetical protein